MGVDPIIDLWFSTEMKMKYSFDSMDANRHKYYIVVRAR